MASDRDALAGLPGMTVHDDELHHAIDQSLAGLYTDWGLSEGLPAPVTVAVHIERDLRAAGWRPPARVITTAAELDALPRWSIVVIDHVAVQRIDTDWRAMNAPSIRIASAALINLRGDLILVHVPTEATAR